MCIRDSFYFIYFFIQASHLFINFASPLRSQEIRLYFVRQFMRYKDDKAMIQMFLLNHLERTKVSVIFLKISATWFLNSLTARIFTIFGHSLEGRVLHKESWVATLLGTYLRIQYYKKVKFPGRPYLVLNNIFFFNIIHCVDCKIVFFTSFVPYQTKRE